MSNFKFENKVILILSPEKWGKIHISKHHYAIELANLENYVYFVTVDLSVKGIVFQKTEHKNITLIKYNTFFPYKLKFHFRKLFDFLMKYQIKLILKKLQKKVDVIWCFDFNIYTNLKYFNPNDISIFHPVDPVTSSHQIAPAKSADLVFSVSEKILSSFEKINKHRFFINHGLSKEFQNLTLINKFEVKTDEKIKIGYFGNLLRPILDTSILKNIITDNKDADFVFWGSYKNSQSNIGSSNDEDVISFINFLKEQKNVQLKGPKTKAELTESIIKEKIDCFILIYKYGTGSDRSNAHKLIEYLSTGKVVIANQFSTYKKYKDLIIMPANDEDSIIPALFQKVISNLDYYNSIELQKKRIEFALDNTYEKQIERIEKIISEQQNA